MITEQQRQDNLCLVSLKTKRISQNNIKVLCGRMENQLDTSIYLCSIVEQLKCLEYLSLFGTGSQGLDKGLKTLVIPSCSKKHCY